MKKEDIKIGMKVRWSTSHIIGEVYNIFNDNSVAIKNNAGTNYRFPIDELSSINETLKDKLKNGTIVELRDGRKYIVVDDTLINLETGTNLKIKTYHDDLTSSFNQDYDIVKLNYFPFETLTHKHWRWKRKESILDEAEKKYLSDVIRPFKKDVKSIRLEKFDVIEYDGKQTFIRINMKNTDTCDLPCFKIGTMYKGMKLNVSYTLKELGLDVD